jgi:predicted DNA-binding transcriptional regulator YafY
MQSSTFAENGSAGSPLSLEPGTASLRLPLARLLQLVTILQSDQFPNARTLADACAVSRRTIYRDLANLEAAGLSVYYSPEKQGYELARECWIQPTQLDEKEALALLLMSRLGTVPDPFGPLLPTRTALAKVIQTLPDELRNRIALCSELMPEDAVSIEFSPERRALYETILSALSQRKRLRLSYRDDEKSALATTKLGLYRLARIQNSWSLVGYSSKQREVRSFALDLIEGVEITDEPYVTPPRFRLDRFLKKSKRCETGLLQEVQLRFSSRVASLVKDMPRQNGHSEAAGSSGDLDLFLKVEALDEIVLWVLGFGDQVEVIGPDELRVALRECAERIVRRYSEHSAVSRSNGSEAPSQSHAPGHGQNGSTSHNGHSISTDG